MVLPRKDATSSIIEKLRLEPPLPQKVVKQTRNSLNIMKTKNPIGNFGKADNERKRAAAILEYVARQECGRKIPFEQLAKAASANKKEFISFHEMIGNFLDNTKSTSKVIVPSKTKQKSSISSLTIQLGAFVPHSSAVAFRAEKLYKQILYLLQKKKLKGRTDGLQDVQTNQEAYEAACFFLIATKDTKGGNRSYGASNDNDNDKQLDLATFLDATKAFTKNHFEMVLSYVTELWEEIQDHKSPQQSNSSRSSASITDNNNATITTNGARKRVRLVDGSSQSYGSTKTKRSKTQDAAETVLELVTQQDGHDQDIILHKTNSGTTTNYSPVFLQWKKKCIESACLSARGERENKDDGGANESSIENGNDCILDLAVREILKRRNLLA